jgi:hypothetical protein
MGPLEWLWRSLTYGTPVSLQKVKPELADPLNKKLNVVIFEPAKGLNERLSFTCQYLLANINLLIVAELVKA